MGVLVYSRQVRTYVLYILLLSTNDPMLSCRQVTPELSESPSPLHRGRSYQMDGQVPWSPGSGLCCWDESAFKR